MIGAAIAETRVNSTAPMRSYPPACVCTALAHLNVYLQAVRLARTSAQHRGIAQRSCRPYVNSLL